MNWLQRPSLHTDPPATPKVLPGNMHWVSLMDNVSLKCTHSLLNPKVRGGGAPTGMPTFVGKAPLGTVGG